MEHPRRLSEVGRPDPSPNLPMSLGPVAPEHRAGRELARLMTARTFGPGELILREGAPVGGLYLIHAGRVKLRAAASEGGHCVIALLGPGDLVGEPSLFDDVVSPADAVAVGDCRLLGVPTQRLHALLERRPAAALELIDLLERRAQRHANLLRDVLLGDTKALVYARLEELAAAYGSPVPDGVLIDAKVTQEELGRMAGRSRETVNRAVHALRAEGCLRMHGRRYVLPRPVPVRNGRPDGGPSGGWPLLEQLDAAAGTQARSPPGRAAASLAGV